jgi:hypothetical protein
MDPGDHDLAFGTHFRQGEPVTPSFTSQVLRNWPLALRTGVFHTNQGRIRRGASGMDK